MWLKRIPAGTTSFVTPVITHARSVNRDSDGSLLHTIRISLNSYLLYSVYTYRSLSWLFPSLERAKAKVSSHSPPLFRKESSVGIKILHGIDGTREIVSRRTLAQVCLSRRFPGLFCRPDQIIPSTFRLRIWRYKQLVSSKRCQFFAYLYLRRPPRDHFPEGQ